MFSLQERAIHTTEKLATQIRSHSRIKEIQTKAKNPMALVKVRSRLKHHVNFYLILNDYVMTGKKHTGERRQEWGLIRRLRTWNKPSRRARKGKVRLPWRNRENIPNTSGEMRPSRHPASGGYPASLCSLVPSPYKPVPLSAVVRFSYGAPP